MKSVNVSLIFAFILGFVGFVTSFGAHIVAVNLPEYAKEVGIGVAMIGFLIAAYDFAEIIAKPIFGTLSDKQGMKKTLLIGIMVFIGASLLYLIVPPQWLLGIRFLQGIGAAALSAVSLALVGVYYKKNRGRAYGIYNAIKGDILRTDDTVAQWQVLFSVQQKIPLHYTVQPCFLEAFCHPICPLVHQSYWMALLVHRILLRKLACH